MSGDLTINTTTTATLDNSSINIGNAVPEGTVGASRGVLRLYGKGQYMVSLFPEGINTKDKWITIPDKDGTLALTSDITNAANSLMGFYPILFNNNGSTLRLKVKTPFAQYSRLWFMFIGIPGGRPSIQFIHAHTENNIPQANIYNILKTDDNFTYTVDSATLDSNNYMEILFKRQSNSYDSMQVVTVNAWCNFGHSFS